MRTLGFTTAFLACLVCAYGQASAPVALTVVQGSSAQAVPAGTGAGAATHPKWLAANTGTATITAFALTYSLQLPAGLHASSGTAERFYDGATEPLSAKAIPPGQSVTLPFAPPENLSQAAPKIQAVVFSNGTSWGDSGWLQRISNRRTYMQQSLSVSLAELNAASANAATTREALIAQFQSAMANEQHAAADRDQKACIASVRGTVLRNLQTVNLAGVPPPLSSVLNHEIQALGTRLTAVQGAGSGH